MKQFVLAFVLYTCISYAMADCTALDNMRTVGACIEQVLRNPPYEGVVFGNLDKTNPEELQLGCSILNDVEACIRTSLTGDCAQYADLTVEWARKNAADNEPYITDCP
ncbi:uncharacterized protein LOC135399938 [Ornithodoros turicata]|uniref:uncharacterized protein LOC135399938 n=1 Tax=Ornithodoros turicata TaxID=34597 RepID=UPI003139683D